MEENCKRSQGSQRAVVLLKKNIVYILDVMTVENKGKLILTEIFPSVQKHDIF